MIEDWAMGKVWIASYLVWPLPRKDQTILTAPC